MAIKLFVLIVDNITGTGYTPTEIDAEILAETIGGKVHFAHRNLGGPTTWAVSEYKSGARAGDGWTLEGAIDKAKRNVNGVGDEKYDAMLSDAIKLYGCANPGETPTLSLKSIKDIEIELAALCPADDDDDDEEDW